MKTKSESAKAAQDKIRRCAIAHLDGKNIYVELNENDLLFYPLTLTDSLIEHIRENCELEDESGYEIARSRYLIETDQLIIDNFKLLKDYGVELVKISYQNRLIYSIIAVYHGCDDYIIYNHSIYRGESGFDRKGSTNMSLDAVVASNIDTFNDPNFPSI